MTNRIFPVMGKYLLLGVSLLTLILCGWAGGSNSIENTPNGLLLKNIENLEFKSNTFLANSGAGLRVPFELLHFLGDKTNYLGITIPNGKQGAEREGSYPLISYPFLGHSVCGLPSA